MSLVICLSSAELCAFHPHLLFVTRTGLRTVLLLAHQENTRRHFCASNGYSSSLLLRRVCLAHIRLVKVYFPASRRVERVKLPSGQEFQNSLDLADRGLLDPWNQGTRIPQQLPSARFSLVCHDCLNGHFSLVFEDFFDDYLPAQTRAYCDFFFRTIFRKMITEMRGADLIVFRRN